MKIYVQSLALLAVFSLAAVQARADNPPRWYAAVSGELVYLQKMKLSPTSDWESYDFGYGYALAGGYRVFPDVRMELEVSDRESTVKHDSFGTAPAGKYWKPGETTAIMANLYYDLRVGSRFVPYLGAGIGDAYVRTTIEGTKTWAMSYQLMAGIAYEFNPSFAVNLGYRYFTGPDVRVNYYGIPESYSNTSRNLEAGFRWSFD